MLYLHLTTNAPAATGEETFMPPTSTSSTNGLSLTAPPVIADTAQSKFIVNATSKVGSANVGHGINPPVLFGFPKLP